jgi:SAM-dependent methyltransferase
MEDKNWWYRARRDLIRRVLKKNRLKFDTILDAGCGTGANLDVLSDFSDSIYGLDISDKALEYSRRKEYAECFKSSVEDFRSDINFELILLMDVLEHIDDDGSALANMSDQLLPGGLMLVSVPAYDFLWNFNDEYSDHKRRYTPGMLRDLIKQSGLEPYSVFGWNRLLFIPTFLYYRFMADKNKSIKKNNLEVIPSFLNGILYASLRAENTFFMDRNVFFGVSLVAVCGKKV